MAGNKGSDKLRADQYQLIRTPKRLTAVGVILRVPSSIAAGTLVRSLLCGMSATDPWGLRRRDLLDDRDRLNSRMAPRFPRRAHRPQLRASAKLTGFDLTTHPKTAAA
jgi:hypothetical protein